MRRPGYLIMTAGIASQLVLHQGGQDFSAPRMTEAAANDRAEALAKRVREQKAAPGSEAALRKHIEALQHDQPNYDDMDSALAAGIRPQWADTRALFASAGQLQSITFKGVGPGGGDIYEVRFEKGTYEWRIILDSAGKTAGLYYMRIPAS
jgi:hypothetical protein